MKNKSLLLAFIAMCCLVLYSTSARGLNYCMTCSDGIKIIIRQRPFNQPGAPRMSDNPFSALLFEQYLILSTDSDWGDADVTVESSGGDYYNIRFDMSECSILIPLNGAQGDNYVITIVTDLGLEYEGEFVL